MLPRSFVMCGAGGDVTKCGLRADTDAPSRGFRKFELSLLVLAVAQKIRNEREITGTSAQLSL